MTGVSGAAGARARLRWQLPVYSPLSAAVLVRALSTALLGPDPRAALARSLAAEFDAESVTLCGSGTDALTRGIRLAAGRVGSDARVALPAYSCFDVATAAVGADLPISLYDIDPVTLGPDLDSLRHLVAEGVRVIVVSPLYGMPVDWAAIEEVAAPAGAILIEDAAQGQGAVWRGRRLGTLGPISILSFGRGKGWTGGAGGALLTRGGTNGGSGSAEFFEPTSDRAVLIPTVVQWAVGRPLFYGLPASIPWLALGETEYREPAPGREMARAAASLIRGTRGAAEKAVAARRRNADFFLEQITTTDRIQSIIPVADADPGYLRLPLLIPEKGAGPGASRAARRLGIAPGYPEILGELPAVISRLVGSRRSWPGAAELVRALVTLPTHAMLSRRDRERIVSFLGLGRFPEKNHNPSVATLAL